MKVKGFHHAACLGCLGIALVAGYAHAGSTPVISSFATSIAHQDAGVKKNIALACEKLNGARIAPKEVFSFNGTVGEGSPKNGYEMGRVLYRDSVRYEPGGGLCQVSSTLFNALLLTGAVIIERHRHYQPVTYVPLGLDATIKYGKKDLRMKNPHAFPLILRAEVNDQSLVVAVLAEGSLKYRYEMQTDEEDVPVPFAEDAEHIRQGISVYVYRVRYREDSVVERALLYRDFYPPVYMK